MNLRCVSCDTDQPPGHRFCEECGSPIGVTQPGQSSQVEQSAAPHLAGVSARGRDPVRNEDAVALAADPAGDVLVICDGVSTSPAADRASAAAATAACSASLAAIRSGADGRDAVSAGLQAAEAAVRAFAGSGDPPLSTIVLAVRRGRRLSVGWLGDSRAYFVGPGPARRLTDDHTPFTEAVAVGVPRSEAAAEPDAFSLTRTLGGPPDAEPDEPDIVTCDLPAGGGCLVLCSDGFWRAAPEPDDVRALVGPPTARPDALALARRLVRHGCDRHGRDNVTAAVLLIPPVGPTV
jgi:serine/threonine protein phosphatase PrpC